MAVATGGGVLAGAPVRTTFPALGTTVSLLVTDEHRLAEAGALLRAQLEELDEACSRFRPTSELMRARADSGRAVDISPLLTELVGAALYVAEITEGLVDPTVGQAMLSIGYDDDFSRLPAVGAPLRTPAVPAPGWRCIGLDPDRRALTVPAGVLMDLGSSAKAFAADRAARDIAARLGTGALVNLGGDIAVAGEPPTGGWPIGLARDASTDPGRADLVVAVISGGLASSGTAVRRWHRGDRALHHIVDPRSGDVAETPWDLVTVAGPSCLVANAASTAAIVAGESAPALLKKMGLPARLVRAGGGVVVLGGWPADAPAW